MEGASVLSWLVTIVHLLIALAFGGLCLARMRSLGTAGALLLLGVALLDVLLTIGYRLVSLVTKGLPYDSVKAMYLMLDVSSAIVSLLSTVMVVVGFILIGRLRPLPTA